MEQRVSLIEQRVDILDHRVTFIDPRANVLVQDIPGNDFEQRVNGVGKKYIGIRERVTGVGETTPESDLPNWPGNRDLQQKLNLLEEKLPILEQNVSLEEGRATIFAKRGIHLERNMVERFSAEFNEMEGNHCFELVAGLDLALISELNDAPNHSRNMEEIRAFIDRAFH